MNPFKTLSAGFAAIAFGVLAYASPSLAQDAAAAVAEAKIDTGDTAWMLTATALVLMMTIPGLALFYGGMVRKSNVLAIMMQSFAVCCLVTILWMALGYSLAFGEGGAYIGDLSKILARGIGWEGPFTLGSGESAVATTIPEVVFFMYQMTFAIITPALITGAFADRMKFSAMLWFMGLWSIVVYAPIAHWVWAPSGWLFGLGVLDFAGGTVVHINAGIAGLVAALMLGKRAGYGKVAMAPHNLTLSIIGASLLWVGWFGFNAGSALAAGGRAGMAMAVTQVATAAAALAFALGFRVDVPWSRRYRRRHPHRRLRGRCLVGHHRLAGRLPWPARRQWWSGHAAGNRCPGDGGLYRYRQLHHPEDHRCGAGTARLRRGGAGRSRPIPPWRGCPLIPGSPASQGILSSNESVVLNCVPNL